MNLIDEQRSSMTEESYHNLHILKQAILHSMQDGVIVFDANLSVQTCNSSAQSMLDLSDTQKHSYFDLPFFKNKKGSIAFKTHEWLSHVLTQKMGKPYPISIWFRSLLQKNQPAKPILLTALLVPCANGHVKNLLLTLSDQSKNEQSAIQNRILDAALNSYDGQFITDFEGNFTKNNFAFSAYTGLLPEKIMRLSIVDWIDLQVTLKSGTNIQSILRALLKDQRWSGEIEVHPDPDTTFYAVLNLVMLRDEYQNIEHYTGTLQDITDIKEAQAEIEHLAYYDDLTQLPNRRLMTEHLEQSLTLHKRNGVFSAFYYLGLDSFKEVNEVYSHESGDQLLQQVALTLKEHLRSDDIIARINGDEFGILTQHSADTPDKAMQHALTLANKLLIAINKSFHFDTFSFQCTASIGIAMLPSEHSRDAVQIISHADLAMHEAKKRGRNRYHFYHVQLSEAILQRRKLEEALKAADYDKEFYLLYQPQISNQTKQVSVEALVRWLHPEMGLIRPDQFIHIAEETRVILSLGHWIIKTAFKQIKQWHDKYSTSSRMSINISPVQFQEPNFVETICKLSEETQIKAGWITLEITEGVLIHDMDNTLAKLQTLSDLGYYISIDDFGTGYSSLSYFQKLPIHEIKIDQSFVFRLPGSAEDIAISNTIIQLANSKNLLVVAEGVETEAQRDFFQNQTCHVLMQGYFYSKPASANEISANFLSVNK